VAQGAANIGAAAFGGMCVTGTIARTATNIRAGARGPVAGMLHAVYVLLFMLLFAPLVAYIPLASLGAVLAVVAWNMAEKQEFVRLLRSSWGDAVVLLATFLLTIFADLMMAIAAGVTLSAFVFLHRMAEAVEVQTGGRLVADDEADKSGDDRATYMPEAGGEVQVYRISGAFFFGAAATVSSVLDRIGQRPKVFILDFTNVPLVDSTATNALEGFMHKLEDGGTRIYFVGASEGVGRALVAAGLREPHVRYAETVQAAVAHWRSGVTGP
jgi:SulP family sulfate permease